MTSLAAIHIAKMFLAAALVLLSSYGAGAAFINRLPSVRDGLTSAERRLFALGCGTALLSSVILLLGLAGLIYDASFIALVGICLGIWGYWGRFDELGKKPFPNSRFGYWIAALVAAPYGWLYLANVLAPEIGSDSTAYHLGLVDHYYREHSIPQITTSIYAFLSQGMEMLFLFAYAFARHDAPKLIHFSLFVATLAALTLLGRRLGAPLSGYVAAILYGAASAVGMDAVTAYNDCALAFFHLMLFYALVVWEETRGRQWPVVLGVLAGFGFAIKLTGAFAVAAAGLYVLYRALTRERSLRPVLTYSAVALFWMTPWLVKNVVYVGNPVAPFANRIFPNPYVTLHWEDNYRNFFRLYRLEHERRGAQDYWELPLEATIRGVRHGGLLGPVFLLAPVALLGWRRRWTPALLGAAAVAGFSYLSNSGTRFLIPALPFIALAMALAFERIRDPWRSAAATLFVLVHAVSSWPSAIPLWREGGSFWHLENAPWRVVAGLDDRQEYLSAKLPGYVAARVLSTKVPAGSRVLSFFALPEAYFPGEVVVSHNGAVGDELAREVFTAFEADYHPSRLMRFSWPTEEVSGIRIRQTVTDERNWWEVTELWPLDSGGERVSTRDWQVDSDLRPWDAHKLIDGDPYTAWRSWRRLEPASIVLSAPERIALSGLHLQAPWGQHFPQYDLYSIHADGTESKLEYGLEPQLLEVDVQAMKERFQQALLDREISAVVGNLEEGGHNLAMPHLDHNPASWGLQTVWEEGPLRIYRVLESIPADAAAN